MTCSSAICNACQLPPRDLPAFAQRKDDHWERERSGVSAAMKLSQVPKTSPQEHHLLNPSNVYIHVYHHTSLRTSPNKSVIPTSRSKALFPDMSTKKNPALFAECPPLRSNISEPLPSNAEKNIPILPTLTHLPPPSLSLAFGTKVDSKVTEIQHEPFEKKRKRAKKIKKRQTFRRPVLHPPCQPPPCPENKGKERTKRKRTTLP